MCGDLGQVLFFVSRFIALEESGCFLCKFVHECMWMGAFSPLKMFVFFLLFFCGHFHDLVINYMVRMKMSHLHHLCICLLYMFVFLRTSFFLVALFIVNTIFLLLICHSPSFFMTMRHSEKWWSIQMLSSTWSAETGKQSKCCVSMHFYGSVTAWMRLVFFFFFCVLPVPRRKCVCDRFRFPTV
jgi:hypothetical protein